MSYLENARFITIKEPRIEEYAVQGTPTKPGLYLHVTHGRATPDEQLDDWGDDAGFFGPFLWAHMTYFSNIRLGLPSDNEIWLEPHADLFKVNDRYYGDISIEYFPGQ